MKNWLHTYWRALMVVAVIGLCLGLRFYPLLIGRTLGLGDNFSLLIPGKLFTINTLKTTGELPWWNPYLFAGLDWIGDINQGLFDPGNLWFMVFTPATAINFYTVGYLVLSMVGFYLLVRRFTQSNYGAVLAMICWGLGTILSVSTNNLTIFASICVMPWAIWAALGDRARAYTRWLFILFVTWQMAVGYPEHIVLTFLVSAFLTGREIVGGEQWRLRLKRWLGWWLGIGALAVLITAWLWLPFGYNLIRSTRMIQTEAQASSSNVQVAELINILVPGFWHNPELGMRWGVVWNRDPNVLLYLPWVLGLGAVLVLLNKSKRQPLDSWLGGGVVFFIILSLGTTTPIYNLWRTLIPIFRFTRTPAGYLLPAGILLSVWLGTLWERLTKVFTSSRFQKTNIIWGMLGLGLLAVLVLMPSQFESWWQLGDQLLGGRLSAGSWHTLARDHIVVLSIVGGVSLNLLLLAVAWYLLRHHHRRLLLLAVIIDLVVNTQGWLFFPPRKVYEENSRVVSTVQPLIADYQHRSLHCNHDQPYTDFASYLQALSTRAPFTDSFIDEQERREFNYLHRERQAYSPDWNVPAKLPIINGFTTLLPQSVNEVWNSEPTTNPGINNVPEPLWSKPELLANWSVGYYLVDRDFTAGEDLPPATNLMREAENLQVYHLDSLARFRFADNAPATFSAFSETPNTISFTLANSPEHQEELIMANNYHPLWRAWVDGEPATISEREGMQVLKLVPGSKEVVLRFVPYHFYIGLAVTGVTLAGVLGYYCWRRRTVRKATANLLIVARDYI